MYVIEIVRVLIKNDIHINRRTEYNIPVLVILANV